MHRYRSECFDTKRGPVSPWFVVGILVLTTLLSVSCTGMRGPVGTGAPSGFFESDGLRIHYEIDGEGYPLVLVHGWGADIRSNWIDTGWVDALRSKRRVIAIDVRGHGKSDKPYDAEAYSYAAMSRDVLALMDHLDIATADLMGYSMGSFMGAHLLGHHAERFTSMILGGIGDETEESAAACYLIADALRAGTIDEIEDPLGRLYRQFAESNPHNDLEALAVSALQMWPEGYPLKLGGEGLGRAAIPVLIVNGSDDHPYVDTVHAFANAIPGARSVTIPGANHLSAVTAPAFKEQALEFLTAR